TQTRYIAIARTPRGAIRCGPDIPPAVRAECSGPAANLRPGDLSDHSRRLRTMSEHRAANLPTGRVSKWISLAIWIVVAMAATVLGSKLTSVTDNQASSWLPRSAEATAALERADAAFPGSDHLVAVVVYARDSGLTEADRAKVAADRAAFAPLALGGRVGDAF